MNKFDAIQKLIDQHMSFDPFMCAEHQGKFVPAQFVGLVMNAVVNGEYKVEDVSFEEGA